VYCVVVGPGSGDFINGGADTMHDKIERLLCITAHPDDETLYAGAFLAMLARRGIATHVLCATRGEKGQVGDPPVCRREDLGEVREAELRCAADVLGVASVEVIGYLNPAYVIASQDLTAFEADPDEFASRIVAACDRLRPDAVITHGSQGEYGHPGHVLVHETVLRAHQALHSPSDVPAPALYTVSAAVQGQQNKIFNDADPADVVIDVAPWVDDKAAAIACHRTQRALFFSAFPEADTLRELMLMRCETESLHRVWVPDGFDEVAFFGREAAGQTDRTHHV
jgi:LmbE family N-acetylglucosaminyl deacetylase